MQLNKEHLRNFLTTELQGNLKILIDPKKKDSFSDSRISTWSHTVVERILHHLLEESNGKVG